MATRKNSNKSETCISVTIGGKEFDFERFPLDFRNIGQLNESGERANSELARMAEPLALAEREKEASKIALEAFWEIKIQTAEGGNVDARRGNVRDNFKKELKELEERKLDAIYNLTALKAWEKMLSADSSMVQTMSRNNERMRMSTK